MDNIPREIEIKFKIDKTKKIDQELVISKNYKLLSDIEGELAIYVNDKLFFHDQYILLMELGISLTRWLDKVKSNIIENYHYETMDYNDGPILELINFQDTLWRIISEWQKFEASGCFELQVFVNAVDEFVSELQKQLLELYNVNLKDYVNF